MNRLLISLTLLLLIAPQIRSQAPTKAEIFVETGHSDTIKSIAFSPDGRLLASGGKDRVVRVWDVSTGMELVELSGAGGDIISVAFSPDGRYLLSVTATFTSATIHKTFRVWDVATATPFLEREAESALLSPEQDLIAIADANEGIRVFNARTGAELGRLGRGIPLAFSTNGAILAVRLETGVALRDSRSGRDLRIRKLDPDVGRLKFSSNLNEFAFLDGEGAVIIQNLVTGSRTRLRPGSAFGGRFKFARDLVAGRLEKLHEGGGAVQVTRQQVEDSALSPDGRILATAGTGKLITLWNAHTGFPVTEIGVPPNRILSLGFSPDGRYLAAMTPTHMLRVWDMEAGQEIDPIQSGIMKTVSLVTPMFTGWDSKADVWTAASASRPFEGHLVNDNNVAFSPDGSYIVGGRYRDFAARVWNVEPFALSVKAKKRMDSISSVAFAPDAKAIAVGAIDRTVALIDVTTGDEVKVLPNPGATADSLKFSIDGKYLAVGGNDGVLRVWDLSDRVGTSKEFRGHTHSISSIAFSPGGTLLASGSQDGSVRLWDIQTGRELVTFVWLGRGDWIAKTPDGRFDTSRTLDGVKGLHWVIDREYLRPIPIEAFLKQYYEPRLLTRVLRCNVEKNCDREFAQIPPIDSIDRTRPLIGLRPNLRPGKP